MRRKTFLFAALALFAASLPLRAQDTGADPNGPAQALDEPPPATVTETNDASGAGSEGEAGSGSLFRKAVDGMVADSGINGFITKEPRPWVSGDRVEGWEALLADESLARMLDRDADGNPTGTLSYGVEQGYYDANGKFVPGHEVHMLFGRPYGVGQLLMIFVCVFLIYLAFVKGFEPLLLFPIGMGGLLANVPLAGVTTPTMMTGGLIVNGGLTMVGGTVTAGGFLSCIFQAGIDTGLFPILIFFGVGAMTDFGPLIANPKMLLLGAAAQLGIFSALIGAVLLDQFVPGIHFTLEQAASIGIIGGADGPTSIWLTTKLAPDLIGPIAVAAYSYMALVPVIQPPLMKLCTTEAERKIHMKQLRPVKKIEKVVFPLTVVILCGLLLPSAVPLMGALMFGNIARESGVVDRLSDTMQNALINIVTILLGISVGSKLAAEKFVTGQTAGIMILGVVAFGIGTVGGLFMAKLMNLFVKEKVNPLIGSAGVSAVPMAARVSNKVGLECDPTNFLLMNAMGPNVAGVIGSAVAAGLLFRMLGQG